MEMTRDSWPNGWRPGLEDKAEDPAALLRADNLSLDNDGALSLASGVANVNATDFGSSVHSCYSKNLGSTKFRFVARADAKGLYSTDGSTWTEMYTGGSATRAHFTSHLGHVLAFSGNARKKMKFDGSTVTVTNVTPGAPTTAPTVAEAAKNDFFFVTTTFTGFTAPVGTDLVKSSNYVEVTTAGKSSVLELVPGAAWNSMLLGASGVGQPTDQFLMYIKVDNPAALKSVRIVFNLLATSDPVSQYFSYQWDNDSLNSPFNTAPDSWSVLKCLRQDFTRGGAKASIGWNTLRSMQIIVTTKDETSTSIPVPEITTRIAENGIIFVGYNENPLNSTYQYIQVNVNNTGSYLARSKPGPVSAPLTLVNGRAQITAQAPADAQVNEVWIYRRDISYLNDIRSLDEPIKLDKWYRVKVLTSNYATAFEDFVGDDEALILNETIADGVEGIGVYTDDEIMGLSESWNNRLLYMGKRDIYISVPDDPGLYRPNQTIRLSGDSAEINLFIANAGVNRIIVGTTKDIYEISGTGEELPDGTIDIRIVGMGTGYPPICRAFCKSETAIFYISSMGVMELAGASIRKLSADLDRLFEGKTRHGIVGIETLPNDGSPFALAIANSKLFVTVKHVGAATKYTLILDIKNDRWLYWDEGPNCLYREEDDTLIGGYGGSVPAHLKTMWTAANTSRAVTVRTTFDSNGQLKNRKDSFTLRVVADTGNVNATISISKDGGSPISLGTATFNGKSEVFFNISSSIGRCFNYQFSLTGTFTVFKLYSFTILYEPLPTQVNYLHIPASNLGSISRKRFNGFPVVIDTLGNTVTITPLIDNVAQAPSTVTTAYKATYVHNFSNNPEGIDIGATISGGPFEFFGADLSEAIAEKLPPATTFLTIPPDDYGTPNRKRHTSYKFQINTRGQQVTFTPIIDGVSKTPLTFTTTTKKTVEYFFNTDTIGIDIGGTLQALTTTPFEYYGIIRPQDLEILPPRLTEYFVPETNFGAAARKKVVSVPMVINTNGSNVTVTPIVDGVTGTGQTINTATKRTAVYYFPTEAFGIDFAFRINGSNPFEFYQLLEPELIDILPVGKLIDQSGPLELERLGRLTGFRVRMLATGTTVNYSITIDNSTPVTGSIATTANKLLTYEVMRLPRTLIGTIFTITFTSISLFHRYTTKVRVILAGNDTDSREIPL